VSASGFDTAFQSDGVPSQAGDTLQTSWRQNATITITLANAPAFASLPENRAGLVVPLTVGSEPVAILYVDNNLTAEPEVPASWPEAVEILAGHASAILARITAMRTSQAVPFLRGSVSGSAARRREEPVLEAGSEEDQAARRYARLLVSEIKLYNESAVRLGREKRDLLSRLQPEVERARRLYEQRVPPTVAKRELYFDQELCQTLADGDTSLLGNPAVMP
jgi:hypothetical protein